MYEKYDYNELYIINSWCYDKKWKHTRGCF
jgi:hypothetical protein